MYGCNHPSSHHQLKAWQTGGVHVRTLDGPTFRAEWTLDRLSNYTDRELPRSAERANCQASRPGANRRIVGRIPQAHHRTCSSPTPAVIPFRFSAHSSNITSATARRLDGSDIDLCHLHHR